MAEYVPSDGCRLCCEIDGPPGAPALLLVNGIGCTTDLWFRQLPRLSERYRVIRYNARGHAGSDVPPGDYTLGQLGRDAAAVIDALAGGRAHVCGLSLGGITALWLAVHAPDRVGGLVLANTAARIGTVESWAERIALVRAKGMAGVADLSIPRWLTEPFRRREPQTVARIRRMLESCPPDGYLGCCAALRDADLRGALGGVQAPTLVIGSSEDRLTPLSAAELLRDGIPGARLATFDCAHLSNVEQPDRFTAAVEAFLDETGRP